MSAVLVGDVLQLRDGRWRVVLTASWLVTSDNRRMPDQDRPPTFGPGSQPYRRPSPPPDPHTRTWRPGHGWT